MTTADVSLSPASRLVTLPPGVPPLTLGWEAAKWASKYLRHPNGERVGLPWEYTLSQVRFVLWWYALDEDGRWLYHHGVRRLSKGSGKSPFAGVLALTEFLAPVRLRHFDVNAPGGCVGQPVTMPLVQIAATAESQTANTMRMIRALAPKGSRVVEEFALDPGKTRYYKAPEGTLETITASSSAAEGAEASFIVADETEHWRPANGGVELSSTLADNLAKSGSRMLETSNAWRPDEGSVAEDTYRAWIAQEEGRTRGKTKILYDARIAPPDTDISDPESLLSALKFVYDDCYWSDPVPILGRIYDPRSKVDDSKRKYLNWPSAATDAWVTQQQWLRLAKPRKVSPGEDIVMFFDGSKSRDATALVGCCVSDGYLFALGVWEPDPRKEDDVVPVSQVDAAVHNAFDVYTVRAFFADVKEWEGFVKVTWPSEFDEQLLIKATPGTKEPQSIAWDMRSHTSDFTMAVELTETEIGDLGFAHDGNAVIARHVGNARRRPNRWGVSIGKESPGSPHKVDAAICVVGARMVRRQLLASKEWSKRSRVNGRGRVIVLS